jgi:hypothetical protein
MLEASSIEETRKGRNQPKMNRKRTWYIRIALAAGVLIIIALGGVGPLRGVPQARAQAAGGVLSVNGQKGISFVQTPNAPFGSQASFSSLERLHNTGANFVSIVASFRQSRAKATSFYRSANDPTDAGIAQIASYARSLGMRFMIQPIVLADDGVWSGWFSPDSGNDWFNNYRDIISGYARLAQSLQADEFCIGTEFFTLTQPQFSGEWRQVIGAVRQYYFGPLTYSANWGDKKTPEYATIDWWDQLDYIGISA